MEIISFKEIYQTDYNLEKLFAMNQYWNESAVFNPLQTPRQTSCLLYFKSCSGIYTMSDLTSLVVPQGSIIYIPQGAKYKTEFMQCDKNSPNTVLIEFELKTLGGESFIASPNIIILGKKPNGLIKSLFDEMVSAYTSPVISYSVLKSILYRILSDFSNLHHQKNIFSKEFYCISKGILYMENNINQEFSIEQIADMCHVSTSCFRRLFKQYSGMSPSQYRTYAKVEYGKKLLQNNALKVAEIASLLGFDDTAYFCRVFKKNTGCTPGEYTKEYTNSI